MDWGSVGGISLAVVGILVAYGISGGQVASLAQPEAFFIVVLGTVGAVITQTDMTVLRSGVQMLRWLITPPPDERKRLMHDFVQWSQNVRREGLLSLESHMNASKDPFVKKGLRMIIDGIEVNHLREIMESEIDAYEMHGRAAVKIWESAGGYSPTIGILGAVLGLIRVMQHLSDPTKLGGGIAVAFVATVYGVGLANLVYLPVGHRLRSIINRQVRQRELVLEGLLAISQGDHPRVIEDRLAAYVE